jgi:general secretion pathway protein N
MSKNRVKIIWLTSGALVTVLVLAIFLPAAWATAAIERATGNVVLFALPEGSLWKGSAAIGWRQQGTERWLPGRFEWHLSPYMFAGDIDFTVQNQLLALSPVRIKGNLESLEIDAGSLSTDIQPILALDPRLSLLQLSGRLHAQWKQTHLLFVNPVPQGSGDIALRLSGMASGLAPGIRLGDYLLRAELKSSRVSFSLSTDSGSLRLLGQGSLSPDGFAFPLNASAERGQEKKLNMLLRILNIPAADPPLHDVRSPSKS